MAVSSTGSAGINVPEIVTGLMEVERIPVTKLQSKSDEKTVTLSSLTVFKAKAQALEAAAREMSSSSVFAVKSTTSTNADAVSARATSTALAGTYEVKVAQTAKSAVSSAVGLSGLEVLDLTVFSLQHGQSAYSPTYKSFPDYTPSSGDVISFSLNGSDTLQAFEVSDEADVEELADAINLAVGSGDLAGIRAGIDGGGDLLIYTDNPIRGLGYGLITPASGPPISGSDSAYGLTETATLSDLEGYLNDLDSSIQANLVEVADGDYTLSITSAQSGRDYDLALEDLSFNVAQVNSVELGGTHAAGDVITLTINGTNFDYTVTADDVVNGGAADADLSRISASMALLFNSSQVSAHTPLTASTQDGLLRFSADTAGTSFTLSVSGSTGSGTLTPSVVTANQSGSSKSFGAVQTGRDAIFSVNGMWIERSNNVIDDVITGVTFDLVANTSPSTGDLTGIDDESFDEAAVTVLSATVRVESTDTDYVTSAVKNFVSAYNDLVSFYRSETAYSTVAENRGTLNGDASVRTFMDRLRGLYSKGIRLESGSTLAFSAIGVTSQLDGTLDIDGVTLAAAVADGLQEKFATGLTIGYESSDINLTSFLTASVRSSGFLANHINEVLGQQTKIAQQIAGWDERLQRIEDRYYRQYAALDALLMRFQSTSNALGSAIDSLLASQQNN